MMRSVRGLAVLLAAMFVLAACGQAASTATAPPASATPEAPGESEGAPGESEGPDTAPSGPPEGQASEFAVAFQGFGLSSLPRLAAIDALREQGYTIEVVDIAISELETEGLAQGQFELAGGSPNTMMLAVEQGAPIKEIADRNLNEWLAFGRDEIETCEDLAASRVAVHSLGGPSAAMLQNWVDLNCPDAGYEPIILEGSENRLAALLADQIDAAPVEYGDSLILEAEGGFHAIVNFARDLPLLRTSSITGYEPWMEENPDVVKAFLRELLLQNRRINSEPGYLFTLMEEYLPEQAEDEESARSITEAYVAAGLFPNDGYLTDEAVQFTIDFFGPDGTGLLESELNVSDVADRTYLDAVLDEIGSE